MSLQWTIVAGFLYGEIGFISLLLIPIVSPKRWKQLFNWVQNWKCAKKINYYFYFFISALFVLMLDAGREVVKYEPVLDEVNPTGFLNNFAATEFRAQRNLYITGITLFLAFVINRLIKLIRAAADLIEELEAFKADAKLKGTDKDKIEKEEEANSTRKRNVKSE